MTTQNHTNASPASQAGLIWSIAELLRGGWKQHEYQDVILPLTLLKRLDSVLSDTKEAVLSTNNQYDGQITDIGMILKHITGTGFYNVSPYDFQQLCDWQRHGQIRLCRWPDWMDV